MRQQPVPKRQRQQPEPMRQQREQQPEPMLQPERQQPEPKLPVPEQRLLPSCRKRREQRRRAAMRSGETSSLFVL